MSGNNSGFVPLEAESYPARMQILPAAVYILLLLLGLWGCLAVYNSTVYSNSPFYFAGRQFIWLLAGISVLTVSSKIPFQVYKKFTPLLAAGIYLPLLLVLWLGVRINGMKGWFAFGSLFIQPSELAKPVFILTLCWICARYPSGYKSRQWPDKHSLFLFFVTFLYILPIVFQPDFGTVMVYIAGFIVVYLLSGGNYMRLFLFFAAFLPFGVWGLMKKTYIVARLVGFFGPQEDPFGAGWHILQFQYTLARGGFWGASWGKSLWANAYLPLSHSDSAFASLTEAIGFIGVVPVIFGFSILAYAGCHLTSKMEDDFSRLYISSIAIFIAVQALIHMSVNVGLIPPTGITLPMFSYGGSSLVSTMFGVGILLSAAQSGKKSA